MESLLNNAVSNELLIVYGLIAIVVIFIIVIIIIDKKESKKKPQNLFDTLNMKIIADPYAVSEERKEKKQLEQLELDTIEIEQGNVEDDFKDLSPIEEIRIVDNNNILKQKIQELEDEIYIEDELEKTQAQLRVEEITKALENAQIDEIIEKDKYEQFEEEQEKNAIISYNELMKSFDKLYTENEKIQYLDDDEIPININELYRLRDEQEKQKKSVKLEEIKVIKEEKTIQQVETTFKRSPYISPVYGIQKPPVEVNNSIDREIESTNQFLQSLKELKNNLD